MNELDGKVAVVTGAGQGVGQGIAFALADLGAKVVVSGRTLSKCEDSAAEIERRGGTAVAVQCDVNELDALERLVATAVDTYGGIQILINNAQEVPLGPLLDITDEGFQLGFNSGPLATHRLMKLCYPHLKGDGSIVNLASAAGRRWDMATYGAYGAVKEAIRCLTRAAACEWGEDGIRTNVILPLAASPGLKWWIEANPEESSAFLSTLPMRRAGDCEEDIGRFVARLCTDDCGFVNGQSIALDGGQALIG